MYALSKALAVLAGAPLLMSATAADLVRPPVPAQCRAPDPMPVIPVTAAPNSTYLNTDAPPARYLQSRTVEIQFVSPAEADRICAGGTAPVCGHVFYACVRGNKLVMPHPGSYPTSDPYAKLMAHELAHVAGWPATHGD